MQKLFNLINENMIYNENNENENFLNKEEMRNMMIYSIIIYIIVVIILLFFGKFLWNQVLSKKITALKPLESIWQFLGLWIIIQLLFCC